MQREKERGISYSAPHRAYISFDVNGMDAQTYGSQGQQLITALSIKLVLNSLS